jgi:hypothetical protein
MNPLIDLVWHYDHGCKSFQCPECAFSSTSKPEFDQHYRAKHSKEEIDPSLQPKGAKADKVKLEMKSEQSSGENLVARYVDTQDQGQT